MFAGVKTIAGGGETQGPVAVGWLTVTVVSAGGDERGQLEGEG